MTGAADVVIVGAGAAGLSLASRIGGSGLEVILVSPNVPLAPRTWCFWEEREGRWDPVVGARWDRAEAYGPEGARVLMSLAPYTYKMVRSPDYERRAVNQLTAGGVRRLAAAVDVVEDGPERATVRGHDDNGREVVLTGRYVYDSRPVPPSAPGRVHLLQHFRGWFVETAEKMFDPGIATFMDFRTPQPAGGVSFGYVLPTSPTRALVEYTEFTRSRLSDGGYDAALRHYTGDVLELGDFAVTDVEDGAIPLTDAPFPRRTGRRVFRIGTAGGATRPSTGYTFAAVQRQVEHVAAALREGRDPEPPAAYTRRHLWMDQVLLRGLDDGEIDGAAFFMRLFGRQPPSRVLRFLDGATNPLEDLAVMSAAPLRPMVRTLLPAPLRR